VDRAALLQFIQYRAKTFEGATFAAQLDAMSAGQRQKLVNDYVREEVLVREAKSLGLEQGDYVIRQRLAQKMSFLLEESAPSSPTDRELQQYLDHNRETYAVAPSWTFAQVFIDKAERGNARAERVAQRMQRILNRSKAGFNDAPRYSDRYPFLQNYVERTSEYVSSHFGAGFMAGLAELPVGTGQWLGPLKSDQGWHLVLISARVAAKQPTLVEVRAQVLEDFNRESAALRLEVATQKLISTYQTQVGAMTAQPR
jgi:hypothetical protein